MSRLTSILRKILPNSWFDHYDTTYLHLYSGEGGIYTFPLTHTCQDGSTTKVMAIGTYGCRTDVAVYLPLDKDRHHCFAVRFNARAIFSDDEDIAEGDTGRGDQPNSENGSSTASSVDSELFPTPRQGERLKAKIISRLEDDFPTIAANGYPEELKPYATVVCPWPDVRDRRAVGDWIMEAVVDFFGLDLRNIKRDAEEAQGFIADRNTSKTIRLKWLGGGDAVEIPDRGDPDDCDPKRFRQKYREQKPQDCDWYACNGPGWSLESTDRDWAWSTGNVPK